MNLVVVSNRLPYTLAQGEGGDWTVERALMELGDDAVIAYLGDDATDEDAFAALGDRGLSVLVSPKLRPTLARAWFVPPVEVLEFLTEWGAVCSRRAPS